MDVAALRGEKAMLEAQLSRKPAAVVVDSRAEDALRQKVTQLQGELDKLLSTYTEAHPDVKRVKRELATAQEELRAMDTRGTRRKTTPGTRRRSTRRSASAARERLDEVNKKLALATGAPVPPPVNLNAVAARPGDPVKDELKGIGQDTTLSELLRRYEATRDIYQDLLKRRERARATMELVLQHRGFQLRVQEPAEMPIAATGLRLSHFCLVGLILSVLIPLGILFAIVKLDGRVRNAAQIEVLAKVPLLVSIPPAPAALGEVERPPPHVRRDGDGRWRLRDLRRHVHHQAAPLFLVNARSCRVSAARPPVAPPSARLSFLCRSAFGALALGQ